MPDSPASDGWATIQDNREEIIDRWSNVAGQSIRNLDWFQVSELRGHIKDGRVAHYQVALKLGFRYEAKPA